MALRWGIVSAGLIASDFTSVLSSLPLSEHQVPLARKTLGLREEWSRGSKEESLVQGSREESP